MKFIARFFALLLIMTAPVLAAGKSPSPAQKDTGGGFTIQQMLSAPFPTGLTAAPAKGRFAWVFNAEGRNNVWVAEPSGDGKGYTARPLTKYADDDGQQVAQISWTPDAESIVYVRGGDFEFLQKPYPNPTGFVKNPAQEIWIVPFHGGEPRKLGEGHSPAMSPKGDAVAYIFKGQVWLAQLNGGQKPEQLVNSHGDDISVRWSPDGHYLAFENRRGDHSFIAYYAMGSKTLNYLDASTDSDSDPIWSPDGQKIAYIRTPTNSAFRGAKRAGPPWSIRVASVESGKGRDVWKAAEGPGSMFREILADDQLFWGAGDRIVFPWEKDGWTHLYSVPVQGGSASILTPGPFEVEYASLSPDRKVVVYSSNQSSNQTDIDRRHIWKIAVDGNTPVALSAGTGIETDPRMSSDNHTVAVLRSDAKMPLRPAILGDSNAIHDLAADQIPADFPAAHLVTPQQVIFSGADGLQIHGQLFLPPDSGARTRHPALLFLHGGSQRQMLLGWHYMDYYSNAYGMNQYLASKGYVVLAVNYRSGIGYGLNFREALNYGPTGASEFNDVLGAGLYLRSRADVDPKRIGLWGGSYGGYLTALGLARSSDLFAAGVDFHGVHDWNARLGYYTLPNPESHTDMVRLAWESSPMSAVKTWRSPVLLVQGDDDRNVPFDQTVTLAEALRKQHVEVEELVFPDEIHDFLLNRTWIAAYSATADFFNRHLGEAAPK